MLLTGLYTGLSRVSIRRLLVRLAWQHGWLCRRKQDR